MKSDVLLQIEDGKLIAILPVAANEEECKCVFDELKKILKKHIWREIRGS